MKKFKKIISLIAVFMLALPCGTAFAEMEPTPENLSGIVRQVTEHLGVYARYDEVRQASLYKDALLGIVEKNPELYGPVLKEMLESIDEHSEYYNEEETAELKNQLNGTVTVGIGVTFEMCDDGVEIMSVIPDMPAYKAGIQVGDILVSSDDKSLVGIGSETAVTYITGEEGTTVRIGYKHKGSNDINYADIVREKILGTSVDGKVTEHENEKIMYIRIYGFIGNTAKLFGEQLEKAKSENIKNLIIDVRDNGGGYLEQAIAIADMLLPKDCLITTEDHKMALLNVDYKASGNNDNDFNIVMLVNENSASASEVLTAALSENDKAYIVGEKTYGKGTIQTVIDLPFNDCIKYTCGYYLTPKKNNIHKIGIEPDYKIENVTEPFDMSNYQEFSYENIYEVGAKSEEVKEAEKLLKAWGVFDEEPDEYFDENTEKAVSLFQRSTGLYEYGVLDMTTQHELYTRLKMSKVYKDNQYQAALDYYINPPKNALTLIK